MDATLKGIYEKLVEVLGHLSRFDDVGYQDGRLAVTDAKELLIDALTELADIIDGFER